MSEPSGAAPRPRPKPHHRPAWIVLVVLGAIFCLFMSWWQLSRFRSAGGTAQNLGYTFMWPVLAVFLVYAYLRYVRLEAEDAARRRTPAASPTPSSEPAAVVPGEDDDVPPTADAPARRRPGARRAGSPQPTALPDDLLPARTRATPPPEDEALREYNAYLAELARHDAADER